MSAHHPDVPEPLAKMLGTARCSRITVGDSGASVFKVDGGSYLKIVARTPEDPVSGGLKREQERLDWLSGRLTVPEVRAFAQDEKRDYLWITEVPGTHAASHFGQADLPGLIATLAEGCRRVHSLPIDDCPFEEPLDRLIRNARLRMERNLVDASDFDDELRGRNVTDLFEELLDTRPREDDLVFTHGDLCLPNVILGDRRVTGFVDLGHAGVSDRWRDLALCTRSIARNLGAHWSGAFLEAYGISIDRRKLSFYRLLDEFF